MENKKIVCLGDSITYGFPYGPQDSWVLMLQEKTGYEFINMGINGDTTEDMLNRFQRSVLRHLPTHVLISGGINDVVNRYSFTQTTNNFEKMHKKALENNIKVIFGLPTPIDYPEFEEMLKKIRKWMLDYAIKNDIKVIDFSRAFYDENGNLLTELLLPDGGHPTREGYKAIFSVIDISVF